MFAGEIKHRTKRNNAAGVNLFMCHVIVALDVVKVHSVGYAIILV